MQDTFTIIDGLTSDVNARQWVHIAFLGCPLGKTLWRHASSVSQSASVSNF